MADTPKPMQGTWTLTAPDGRTWQADSPLRVVAVESRERIPATVALERIYAAASEDHDWLPIHEAPKDGTPVLVCNDERNGSWIAYYHPVYQSGYRPSNPWASLMLNCDWHKDRWASYVPTRWLPIPAPGSQAGTEGRPTNEKESPDFCDTHCTWMDHHPDCERAAPYPPVDAQWVDDALILADHYGDTRIMASRRLVERSDVDEARAALRTHLNTALSGETP